MVLVIPTAIEAVYTVEDAAQRRSIERVTDRGSSSSARNAHHASGVSVNVVPNWLNVTFWGLLAGILTSFAIWMWAKLDPSAIKLRVLTLFPVLFPH